MVLHAGCRATAARLVFVTAAAGLLRPAAPTCELPVELPEACLPAAATAGPEDTVVIGGARGMLLFADLVDFSTRLDPALRLKYGNDELGSLDVQGVTMTNTGSTYLYLGLESQSKLLEYEWHTSHQIFRSWDLKDFETAEGMGLQCLTFVSTKASPHEGYFYVGTRISGHVYIYEVPLLNNEGTEAQAESVKIWHPLEGNKRIAGLDSSDGYIFVSYDDGTSTHVLIYPVLQSGFPGDLLEQYQVDVVNAIGMAVRRMTSDSWEVIFTSGLKRKIYAYSFRFVTGFQLHSHCASLLPKDEDEGRLRPWQRGAAASHSAVSMLSAVLPLLLVWSQLRGWR